MITKDTAKWAETKNRALRKALIEISAATIGLKKAEAAMKKALASVKDYQEASDLTTVLKDIVESKDRLSSTERLMSERADRLWADVLEFKGGMNDDQSTE